MVCICYYGILVVLTYNVAENEPHEGKRKAESLWPISLMQCATELAILLTLPSYYSLDWFQIFRLHHQRSRYIYELFYRKKEISRELYEWCLSEGIADKNLIAKWKKVWFLTLLEWVLMLLFRAGMRDYVV